jgi:SEC-C motif-containing protein
MAQSPAPQSKPESSSPCPCGSGQSFGLCCEPIISGQKPAPTAEALMRARFTAHVTGDYQFLHQSYLPTSNTPYVEETELPKIKWTKLVVHSHELGTAPDVAFVDFSAYHDDGKGNQGALHEKAEFVRHNGGWIYTRSVREGPPPVRLAQPKPGRNDPCPCGSGKKYKHCCLNKAA